MYSMVYGYKDLNTSWKLIWNITLSRLVVKGCLIWLLAIFLTTSGMLCRYDKDKRRFRVWLFKKTNGKLVQLKEKYTLNFEDFSF